MERWKENFHTELLGGISLLCWTDLEHTQRFCKIFNIVLSWKWMQKNVRKRIDDVDEVKGEQEGEVVAVINEVPV